MLNHSLNLPYQKIFKIRNTDLQLRSPGHGWQRNKKKEKKNAGNCKALYISCKCSKWR